MEVLQVIVAKFEYPVVFARDLFAAGNGVVAEWISRTSGMLPVRALVFVDNGVARAHPRLSARITAYCERYADVLALARDPLVLPGGEEAKNSLSVCETVIRAIHDEGLCRHSLVVAVGGGAFLDAVGFAASLVHRGMRMVRIPTTVLSQNDSGVGVKTGLNFAGVKNFLGTFAPPAAVFNDPLFLTTLTDRDWIAGIAEAYKVAVVRDAAFLDWLIANRRPLAERDLPAMETLIRRCASLHIEHIALSGDPFEQGQARPLDFGHWAAHKIESLSRYAVRHGEAVAVGMAVDLFYAVLSGLLRDGDARRIVQAMHATGLPVWHPALDQRDAAGRRIIFDGVEEFRKHLGGILHITLPNGIGRRIEVTSLDFERMEQALERLRRFVGELRANAPADR